jgi:cytochrome c biogenesis protein CcmG/thiol:disulfide interchange protein DsbE
LNVTGVPETYIVDAQGRLRYRHLGPITDQIWAEVLLPLISNLEAAS